MNGGTCTHGSAEQRGACPGAEVGGFDRATYTDDAVHLTDPVSPQRTLCKQSAFDLNVRDLADERPDGWAGCWSCLMAAKKIDAVIGAES